MAADALYLYLAGAGRHRPRTVIVTRGSPLPSRKRALAPLSKVRFGCGRDLVIVEPEIILIILCTDEFLHRCVVAFAVSHHAAPWHVERARIVGLERDFDRSLVRLHLPPLDHMKLGRVRRAVVVYKAEGVFDEPDRVDDQRVAILVMSD